MFTEGQVIHHPYGRTVDNFDNLFATLTALNTAQAHFNLPFAQQQMGGRFRERLVVGSCVLALATGLASTGWPGRVRRELGLTSLRFMTPTYLGDTISSSSTIIECVQQEEGDLHLVTDLVATNQDGAVLVQARRSLALAPAAVRGDSDSGVAP